MNRILSILLIVCSVAASAQPALQHYGGMQFHEGAQVGMYFSLVNQAPFEQESGLLGFYGVNPSRVSGEFAPLVRDLELFNATGVDLEVSLSVGNNLNFIEGDIRSPRDQSQVSLALLENALPLGTSDVSKVDGYAVAINRQSTVFPVGDAGQYRPLILEGEVFPLARCAYFRENPNSPSTFPPFLTDLKPRTIEAVSTREFWRLEGSSTGAITLSWNPRSELRELTEDPAKIVLMGWDKGEERWLPLPTDARDGDLERGFIRSAPVVPDQYAALTFGSETTPAEFPTTGNFFLSPNGDGINDVLVIEELADSPNNLLQIFDRRGLKVFEMENYRDEFSGVANVGSLIFRKEAGLPEDIYYYVLQLYDLGLEYQGFLFLER